MAVRKPKRIPKRNIPMVIKNIAFARHIAGRFHTEKVSFAVERDEYESAALLGLCDAALRFKAKEGVNFKTYAYLRIKGAMYDMLRSGTSYHARYRHTREKAKLEEAKEKTPQTAKSKRSPDLNLYGAFPVSVLADSLDYRLQSSRRNGSSTKSGISSKPGDDNLVFCYTNQRSPEELLASKNTCKHVRKLISKLSSDERKVIIHKYYEGSSFEQMRPDFNGASKSSISRLHNKALENLKLQLTKEEFYCQAKTHFLG